MKRIISIALVLVLLASSFAFAEPVKTEGEKTFQEVLLNGEKVELGAYLINQRNYVKLRDVAALLTATESKFNVDFDKETKKVMIKTGEAYEKQENDLVELPEGKVEALISEQAFVFNGEEKAVETALINQNNYLQLRQLGELVGFKVDYNKETKAIELSTKMEEMKGEMKDEKAEDKKEMKDEKAEDKKEMNEMEEKAFVNNSEMKELSAETQEKIVKAITEKVAENKELGAVKNITLTKYTEEMKEDKKTVTFEGTVKTDKKELTFMVTFVGEEVKVELTMPAEKVEEVEKKAEEKTEMKDEKTEEKKN